MCTLKAEMQISLQKQCMAILESMTLHMRKILFLGWKASKSAFFLGKILTRSDSVVANHTTITTTHVALATKVLFSLRSVGTTTLAAQSLGQ